MEKRLLDHDPTTGVTEWFHYDSMSDTTYVESTQDVTPIRDGNRALANDEDYWKHGMKQDMAHYASIPVIVQLRWYNEYGPVNWPMLPQNSKLLFRLLNSPEWRYLKTTNKVHIARS
jgi:hypothetical protein